MAVVGGVGLGVEGREQGFDGNNTCDMCVYHCMCPNPPLRQIHSTFRDSSRFKPLF